MGDMQQHSRGLKTQTLLENFRRSGIWQNLKNSLIKIKYFIENRLSKLYSSNMKFPIYQEDRIRNKKEENERKERGKSNIQLVSWCGFSSHKIQGQQGCNHVCLRATIFIFSGHLLLPRPRHVATLGPSWAAGVGGGTASLVPDLPLADNHSGLDQRLQGDGVCSSACPIPENLHCFPPATSVIQRQE